MAPTLSGLLGVPVPRHNQGKFIDEILQMVFRSDLEIRLSYLDLRNQKSRFMKLFSESKRKIFNAIISIYQYVSLKNYIISPRNEYRRC